MASYQEFFDSLKRNNLDKNSSPEDLDNVLSRLNYSREGKQEVFEFLKSQGWFSGGGDIQKSPEKIAAIPAQTTNLPEIKSKKIQVNTIAIILIALLSFGTIYAYVQKIGPFSSQKYSEENFLADMLKKVSQINSSSYTVSSVLKVVPRDEGAEPFTIKEASNAAELKQKYYYDSVRLEDASAIISQLNSSSGYYSPSSYYYPSQDASTIAYPGSIETLFSDVYGGYYGYGSKSVTDPVTDKNYEYQITDGGKNFLLTVDFETDYAIKAIKRYDYEAASTIITGRRVSFTKDSSSYFYMSSEPPKPFLATIGESIKTLPPDISVESSISASSEMKSGGMADWLFNINAEGDFGDLTYKINADALKKGDDYYFKINNFPSIFLFGDLVTVKGKWVNISSDNDSSAGGDSYSLLASLKERIPQMEKSYKESREKVVKFLKKTVAIADEEKLIIFKNQPRSEKVDGRQLIRYELSLRKEAMLPFYTRLQDEINKDPDFSGFGDVVDQGLIDYLKSEEFEEVFAYFDKNNAFVFWTDTKGFPAIIQNSMRIVPPDTATQLQDKQISIVFKLIISDINKPSDIKAPLESVPIEKLISDFENNVLGEARGKARDAVRKADMRQIVTAMEMYYGMENVYYTNSGTSWPSAIGTYMPNIPTDPLKDTETPYVWVDNTGNNQKFCVYATLEDGKWYTSSYNGNYTCLDVKPTLNDCCF
ncbi:MAG: hypothetical protein ABIG29_01130 [Candidatus Nealsonbacteria bacterium]